MTSPGDVSTPSLRRQVNLVRELAITQFKLKYTGSALGYAWSLVKPLMIFAIMYMVFGLILKAGSGSPHFTLQLLVGIVLWGFFADTVGGSISVVATNGSLIKKAFFPRIALVLASSLTASMTFAINLGLILLIAWPLHQIDVGWRTLIVVPLVLEMYLLILGISLLLSALFVFYRDLGHIWEVSSQALFYGSAIVYPLTPTFLGHWTSLLALNPIAQIVEDVRHAMVTSSVPWTVQILGIGLVVPLGIVGMTTAIGGVVFRRLSPRFSEYL